MVNQHGHWIWYELLTSDADAAQGFYGKVVGWTAAPAEISGAPNPMDYRILTATDGENAGGLMTLPDGAPMSPAWRGYIGVDDVDAAVAAVESEGGRVLMPAMDVPGVGRMALLADPQGITFYVMKGAVDQASTAYGRRAMGHCSWNELIVPDDAAALGLYERVFGIVKVGALSMGDMGEYSFLKHPGADEAYGALMRQQPDQPAAGWRFYFRVPDIEIAAETVRSEGGRIVMGPMEVPGGEWVLSAIDPQGAAFGLVAPARG